MVLEQLAGDGVTLVEAGSVTMAAEAIRQHPDLSLVFLDLHMPGMDGVAGLQRLHRLSPRLPIIVLTASEDARYCRRALDSGAMGYVTKSSNREVVMEAIRTVLAGQTYVSPTLTIVGTAKGELEAGLAGRLTTRQTDVLTMLRKGKTNAEIGRELDLAEITVKMHVTAIFRILKVHNRTQAALFAEKLGL